MIKVTAISVTLGLMASSGFAKSKGSERDTAQGGTIVSAKERSVAASLSVGRGDIVRLKSGGIVRGTIDEKLPGEHVIVTTPLGTTRRFDWKDVKYAGPAGDIDTRVIDLDANAEQELTDEPSSKKGDVVPNEPTQDEPTVVKDKDELKGNLRRDTTHAVNPSPALDEGRVPTATLPIAFGATGTLLLGVAVVGAINWSRHEGKLSAMCGSDRNCHDGKPSTLTIEQENEVVSLNRDRKIYQTLTLVSGGLGLGALIVTGTLLLSTSTKGPQKASSWNLERGPLAADRGGMSLQFRF